MPEFKKLFNDLIRKVEGHKEEPYVDTTGNPTIGTGLNLNDHDVRGLLNIRGIDPEQVKTGQRRMVASELDDVQKHYVDKREKLVRDKLGPDLYDQLPPHQKASIMSMGYQSLNNIGPNLTSYIAGNDPIGAIREMVLNTNKHKDPGILKRRFEEAEMFGGPLDFSAAFKTMTPEEKRQMREMFDKIENEHSRNEVNQKYGSYLAEPKPQQFTKLQKLMTGKIGFNNQD